MRAFKTTQSFLLSKSSNPTTDDIVQTQGYASVADGLAINLNFTGNTGVTPSTDFGNGLFSDADGNEWNTVPTTPIPVDSFTTTELINSSATYSAGYLLTASGFLSAGDGGAAQWQFNGETGQTPSQSPAQLGDALLNDANGNQWVYVANSGTISMKALGVTFDGVTDDRAAANAALKAADTLGAGVVIHDGGNLSASGTLYIYANTTLKGENSGKCIITTTAGQAIRNNVWGSSTEIDENIVIDGIGFTPGGRVTTGGSFQSIKNFTIQNCRFFGYGDDSSGSVTGSIGIGGKNGQTSSNIKIINNEIQSNDYCIVLDSTSPGDGLVETVVIEGNSLVTDWGSGVSLSGNVRDVKASNNKVKIIGTGGASAPLIRGLGFKVWNGSGEDLRPLDISIYNNQIEGPSDDYGEIKALTVGSYSDDISFTGNKVRYVGTGVEINFANDAENHTISGNTFRNVDYAYVANVSSDTGPTFEGNKIYNAINGCNCTLRSGIISSNTFKSISGDAIILQGTIEAGVVSGNTFLNIGESAINMAVNSGSAANAIITGNTFRNISQNADGGAPVLNLNLQPHNITGNTFWNSDTNKPNYIIAGLGSDRVITSNWMFGATIGYVEAISGSDIYESNKERGL